jgi:hypothetical protein
VWYLSLSLFRKGTWHVYQTPLTETLFICMTLLHQVRCVARKAAALREASAALAGAKEALVQKEQQLAEAKEAKVRLPVLP